MRSKILAILAFLVTFSGVAEAHYNPKIGRFMSRDPIEERGGSANVYEFARNDSVNLWDKFGLSFEEIDGPRPTFNRQPNGDRFILSSMLDYHEGVFINNRDSIDKIKAAAKQLGEFKDAEGNECFDVVIDYRPQTMSMIHSHMAYLKSGDLFIFMSHGMDYKIVPDEKPSNSYQSEQYVQLLGASVRTDYLRSLTSAKTHIAACYHWPYRNKTCGSQYTYIQLRKWIDKAFKEYKDKCKTCLKRKRIVVSSGPRSNRLPRHVQSGGAINNSHNDPGIGYIGDESDLYPHYGL